MSMPELKDLIKPHHLKFMSNMLGIEEEKITLGEEPAVISETVSGGQNSQESSQNSQNNSIDEEVYQK